MTSKNMTRANLAKKILRYWNRGEKWTPLPSRA